MRSFVWVLLALFLLGTHAAVNTTDFWRESLGLAPTDMHFQSFAGYQRINQFTSDGNMYYQLFGAVGNDLSKVDTNTPLIIWLQGGPGGSSQFGAFTENGPIRINKGRPSLFQHSWNYFGHMLFIDQPLNVGFSYAGNRTGTKQVSSANEAANHLVNFLDNFYKEWPQLRTAPLYITGESFAGHYIPAFARQLILNGTFKQLKGVSIGDGWTDPPNQFNYYDSLLYSAGIVSNKFRDTCNWFQTEGIIHILNQNYTQATQFFDFLTNDDEMKDKYLGGMNNYNFRQYAYGDESFAQFLQSNRAKIGVPAGVDYIPGSEQVYDSFKADITKSYASDVVVMLRNIRVLIYNGQDDFVVNTAGVLQYLNSLRWENIANWKRARKEVWTIYGQVRGWAKVYGNLWFVLLNKAGHLVPTDQPESAFSMLGHFLLNDKEWRQ